MTKKGATTDPEQSDSLIYCGPNLPRGALNQFSVYQGGYPEHLEKQYDACPAIKRLFVSVEQLAETQLKIAQAGTPENIWYKEVQAFIQGGAKA